MDFVADVLLPIGEFVWTLGQLLVFTLIDIVRACLPIGVLPRKSIKGTRSYSPDPFLFSKKELIRHDRILVA